MVAAIKGKRVAAKAEGGEAAVRNKAVPKAKNAPQVRQQLVALVTRRS
jgi:hypothetical protein